VGIVHLYGGVLCLFSGGGVGVPDCITDAGRGRGVGWQLRQEECCRYRWRRGSRISAVPLFRHELTLFLTYVLLLGATPIYLADFFTSASKKFAAGAFFSGGWVFCGW
jgi:hypothetical protein